MTEKKKTRIFYLIPEKTPKIPRKEANNTRKSKELHNQKQNKEKKTREGI